MPVQKNTPLEKNTLGVINLKNTKPGAEEHFMLLDCVDKARIKGVFVHRHRHHLEKQVSSELACECL